MRLFVLSFSAGSMNSRLRRIDETRAGRDHAKWQAQRAGFSSLTARAIAAVMAPSQGQSAGLVVELGAGAGQLARWLPNLAPGIVQVEQQPAYLALAGTAGPRVCADVHSLPFANGSVSTVVALCAFDVLKDAVRVAKEVARVLTPNGRFLHFLDMGTNLEPALAAAVAQGCVALPNVFLGQEGVVQEPLRSQLSPLTDLLYIQARQFATMVGVLARLQSAAAPWFADWGMAFLPTNFDAQAAARMFVTAVQDRQTYLLIASALRKYYELSQQPTFASLGRLSPQAASSLSFFRAHLRQALAAANFGKVTERLDVATECVETESQTQHPLVDAAWVGSAVSYVALPPWPDRIEGLDVRVVAGPVLWERDFKAGERGRLAAVYTCEARG